MDKTLVVTTINENRDRLNNISKEIWANPEGSFEEKHAHDILTQFFTEEGFEVERNYISATGFKATFGSSEGENRGIHVCFLCEYDAIPDLGHAAGHNLCSEASAAAALAIKRCIQQKKVDGKVTVLGAPAENSTGGTKIDMIQKNAFDTVDIGMMLTAMNSNIVYPKHYLLVVVNVSYKGKSAHASAFPWEGRNALDAAVACYNNISLMRQQLKPTWMVNGIITKGGVQPNLIPDYSELKLWLRAPTHMDLVHIQQKCQACIVAAAKATGCEAQFSFDDKMYYPMQHNEKLGEMYKNHAQDMGLNMDEQATTYQLHTGSTDMGNVSQIIPCINPSFDIGTRASHYSKAFQEAAGSDTAHENAIRAATALALTAADVMSDPSTLEVIKSEYTPYKSASGHMLLKHRSVSSDSHH